MSDSDAVIRPSTTIDGFRVLWVAIKREPWVFSVATIGAVLFGAVSLAQLAAQAAGIGLNSQFLASLPYIVTIAVLGVISSNRRMLRMNGVASLGQPFEP